MTTGDLKMADPTEQIKWNQVSSILNFAHPTNWVLEIPIKSVGLFKEL